MEIGKEVVKDIINAKYIIGVNYIGLKGKLITNSKNFWKFHKYIHNTEPVFRGWEELSQEIISKTLALLENK
jgi:hypothetical protein